MNKRNKIDVGLDRLLKETPYGVPLTQQAIADRCGCAYNYISALERKAFKKLRKRSVVQELRASFPTPYKD